jgi:hypothetical protein
MTNYRLKLALKGADDCFHNNLGSGNISHPDLFRQIISGPGGFEYGPTTPKSLVGVLVLNPNMTE